LIQRRKRNEKGDSAIADSALFRSKQGFAQDVRYNFDKDADFAKYKTYKWVTIKDSDHLNELTEKQITAALDAELAKKGLTKTDADNADLYIGYQTAVGSEKQFNSYSSG
jgi:hypothetical protein